LFQADFELRQTIIKVWPYEGKEKIDLLVPPREGNFTTTTKTAKTTTTIKQQQQRKNTTKKSSQKNFFLPQEITSYAKISPKLLTCLTAFCFSNSVCYLH
jgi:hypothetical protein